MELLFKKLRCQGQIEALMPEGKSRRMSYKMPVLIAKSASGCIRPSWPNLVQNNNNIQDIFLTVFYMVIYP